MTLLEYCDFSIKFNDFISPFSPKLIEVVTWPRGDTKFLRA